MFTSRSTGYLALLLPLFLAGGVSSAAASVIKGPFLENLAGDRVTISWEADESTQGVLRYGPGKLTEEVEIPEASGMQSVSLTGLLPGKTYFYRLEFHNGSFTPTLTFTTAPVSPEPFHFVVFGDTRTNHSAHRQVVALLEERQPDFYLNTGDIVENGDDAGLWQIFFDIEHAAMSRMVMWPVMGNHDKREGTLFDVLFHPDSSSGTSRYYSFDYSNCHFLVLCSEEDFSPASAQYQWADADLAAARADQAIEHIFAFYHRPSFSSGWHGSEELPLAEYLHPLFRKHGVEIVFSGHDHDYERSTVDGITYIVTGGGGAPYPPLLPEDEPPRPDRNPYRQVFLGVFHLVDCAVQQEVVSCQMIDLTRNVRDTFGVNLEQDSDQQPPQCQPCEGGCLSAAPARGSGLSLFLAGVAIVLLLRRRAGSAAGSRTRRPDAGR